MGINNMGIKKIALTGAVAAGIGLAGLLFQGCGESASESPLKQDICRAVRLGGQDYLLYDFNRDQRVDLIQEAGEGAHRIYITKEALSLPEIPLAQKTSHHAYLLTDEGRDAASAIYSLQPKLANEIRSAKPLNK